MYLKYLYTGWFYKYIGPIREDGSGDFWNRNDLYRVKWVDYHNRKACVESNLGDQIEEIDFILSIFHPCHIPINNKLTRNLPAWW